MTSALFSRAQPSRYHQRLLGDLPKLDIGAFTLKKFTLFPKLPVEIRCRIWRFTSFVLRRIVFHYTSSVLVPDTHGEIPRSKIDGQTTAPAILHTCSEARVEGLRYYTRYTETVDILLLFDVSVNGRRYKPFSATNFVYINREVDIFIRNPDPFHEKWYHPKPALGMEILQHVTRFEISVLSRQRTYFLRDLFIALENLVHLTVIFKEKALPKGCDEIDAQLFLNDRKEEWIRSIKQGQLKAQALNGRLLQDIEIKFKLPPTFLDEDPIPITAGYEHPFPLFA